MSAVGLSGTFADMLEVAQPGDYLFQWNTTPISYSIEEVTEQMVNGQEEHGPSHDLTILKFPEYSDEFFEMEEVFVYGFRVLPLSHYACSKNRMLLCRRKGATEADVQKAIGAGMSALGRPYELEEEIKIALNKLVPWHPFHKIKADYNRMFCSGALEWEWLQTGVPFAPAKNGGNLTPMQCMLDAGTEYVMWVN